MMRKIRNRRGLMIVLYIFVAMAVAVVASIFLLFTSADRSVLSSKLKKFEHDGQQRTYLLYVPKVVTPDTKVIVGLHGYGGGARKFAYYSALHNATPDSIIIYPNAVTPKAGQNTGWNASFCCGSGWKNSVDDVGFLMSLLEAVAGEYDASGRNFFATGFSNGAFMSQRLAVERPEMFRAIASVAGSIGTENLQLSPGKSVPILLMHGKKDRTIPFEGGVSGSDADFTWLSHAETVQTWRVINGDSTETQAVVFDNDTHQWHDWRLFNFWHKNTEGSRLIAEFFDNY